MPSTIRSIGPYGFQPGYSSESRTRRPILFQSHQPGVSNDAAYQKWLDSVFAVLEQKIWPRWDPAAGWTDPAGVRNATELNDFMVSATEADLKMMIDYFKTGPLNELPVSTRRSAIPLTNLTLFNQEDGDVVWPRNPFGVYNEELEKDGMTAVRDDMQRAFYFGMGSGAGHTAGYFKQLLQRPRPHTTAFLFGKKEAEFPTRIGKTGNTPSAISGHCYQGVIGGAAVLQRLHSVRPESATALAPEVLQFMVDFGDRRVMAGVHYPSDNLASWICALKVAPHLFGIDPRIYSAMWVAITEKSAIYKLISAAIASGHADVFIPAWKELQDLKPAGM